MPNKTSETRVKEQTPLLPKDTKEKHHKHKGGSHKKCPDCQKDAGLAAAEAAKSTKQGIPAVSFEGDHQSDSKVHSNQNLLATKARAVKNANRLKQSEDNSGQGSEQKQQTTSLPDTLGHFWEDLQKIGHSAKEQVTKNLDSMKEHEREAAEEFKRVFETTGSKQKAGLARAAQRVKNANRFLGHQDQEHQRSEEYADDVVDYLEGEECRHRNRNKKMFIFSFLFAVMVLSGLVVVISLADMKRDKSS